MLTCHVSPQSLIEKIAVEEQKLVELQSREDSLQEIIDALKLQGIRELIFEKGLPGTSGLEEVTEHSAMFLCYDEKHEQAKWVVHIVSTDIVQGNISRTNDFREDPLIITGTACKDDYWYSGYDRGHLAPSADFRWSQTALSESYFYSNMSPQKPELNRKRWADLENSIRQYVEENGEPVFVVTGGVLRDGLPVLKAEKTKNNVSIPEYFYKVVADLEGDEIKGIAFLMPNGNCDYPVFSYAVSIDSVEALTGIDFFASLPVESQKMIESDYDISLWQSNRGKGENKPLTGKKLPKGCFNAVQAKSLTGKTLSICGTVVSTKYSEKSGATFINLDRKFPNQIFSIVIWKTDKDNFSYDLSTLEGKTICVHGLIQDYNGTTTVYAKNEKEISILDED